MLSRFWSQVIDIIVARKWRPFADLFVFNHLTRFRFRAAAKKPSLTPTEKRELSLLKLRKTVSHHPSVCQEKVDCLVGHPKVEALQLPGRGSLFRATQTNAARLFRAVVVLAYSVWLGWPLSAICSEFSGRHVTLVLRAARSAAS
jgi:hypothetical protein